LAKKTKKRIRNAGGTSQPATQAAEVPIADNLLFYQEKGELVDYESEEPGVISAAEDEVMRSDDDISAQEDEPAAKIQPMTNFPAFLAEDSNVRSQRRSHFFQEGGGQPTPPIAAPSSPEHPKVY
jgi:hypothetical protein